MSTLGEERAHPANARCDGIEYMQIDPFGQEIYGDNSLHLMCDCQAYERAMDI